MRILLVISGLGLGGAERQVVLLAREMARLGNEVTIYTLNAETPRLDELAGSNVHVRVDQKCRKLDWALLRRLRHFIRRWQPEIVHGFLYDGDLYSRIAAVGTGTTVLNSERSDGYVLKPIQRIGYRLTAALYDGIVANSYAGAAFAMRLHRCAATEVAVVWNGIDLEEVDRRVEQSLRPAEQLLPGPNLKRMCLVGSIKPEKDYLLALRTARILFDHDASWRLLCVGDSLTGDAGAYKSAVLEEHQRLRLAEAVQFVGHRRDVLEIMSSCDILLVTSTIEGFPNVVLEAMASGTTVVTTEYSDVRRIVTDPAQIVASRSPERLAAAVLHCHADLSRLAKLQREWVELHCTAAASAKEMLAVYERLSSRRKRPGSRSR